MKDRSDDPSHHERTLLPLTYFWLIVNLILKKDPPPQCEHGRRILTVRHILVHCNHLAQATKDIFRGRDVVELFRFHPTLILLFLKES